MTLTSPGRKEEEHMPVAAAEVAGKLAGPDDFKAQIKDIVDARHCIRHPLVEAWAAGKLTRPQMAAWVREHYHFTKDMWAFLAAVYSNCPYPDARAAIMDNLSEEQDPNDPHTEILLTFAAACGADPADPGRCRAAGRHQRQAHKPAQQKQG